MRNIKFRGKSIKDGKWVYGYFLVNQFDEYTICDKTFATAVIPETVGQYAGLPDKNNKEIYEGDILKRGETTDEVIFEDGAFCIKFYSKNYKSYYTKTMQEALSGGINRWKIIGNKFENSELLNKNVKE